jgi:LysR family transcriptional regulator for bpeEF and oprC
MDYNLLKIFVKVSELGSFTQAAKVLNQPKLRVSRAIARLENELDIQLIRRTTRKTSLTTNGQEFYHNISPLLNGINDELTKVSNQQQEMSGIIRLTASQDIGLTLVVEIILAFNAKYPNIQFQSLITNDFLDLAKENIDIAFRAGKLPDSSLIQKKVLDSSFAIVCSKNYLENYGCPSSDKDLTNHKFLSFKGMEKDLLSKDIAIQPTFTTDSIPMLLNMALSGRGIAILPDFFCKEHLESKALLKLLPSWKSKKGSIHILYAPSKNISRKVRAFVDLSVNHFKK